jgi:hypothetical protein
LKRQLQVEDTAESGPRHAGIFDGATRVYFEGDHRIVSRFEGWQCEGAFSSNIIGMKHSVPVSLVLIFAAILVPALAFSQIQPAPDNAEPLSFVKTATDIAGNVQSDSLAGRLAIYISQDHWADGLKDGDLGPFLKVKEAKAGRSAVCIFNDTKDAVICVYFDGKEPFGVVALKTTAAGSFKPADISAAFKPVSKDMLEKSGQELKFNSTEVNTDDEVALPGFLIVKQGFPQP